MKSSMVLLVLLISISFVSISCGSSKVKENQIYDGNDKDVVVDNEKNDEDADDSVKPDADITDNDTSSFCGNDIVQEGEICDGNVEDCVNINSNRYKAGKAKCKNDCSGFDTVTCEENDEFCGDGILNLDEVCDGDAFFCTAIDPLLYSDGIAECKEDCSGYDTSTCNEIVTECGDGKVEGKEVCEKEQLIDCKEIDSTKYKGGKAYCFKDCSGWDTITCEEASGIVFSDNFENGSLNWILTEDWEIGEPLFESPGMSVITVAHSGKNVLATNLTGIYSKSKVMEASTADTIKLPVSAKITLEFMAYVWTDYDGNPGAVTKWYDGMTVLYMENGETAQELNVLSQNTNLAGSFDAYSATTSSYTVKNGVRGHSAPDTYSRFSVDLSDLSGKSVELIFRFYSDQIDRPTDIGIYIDDVVIKAD